MADSATAEWEAQLAQLTELSDDDLTTLESDLVTAFDAADSSNDEAAVTELADALDQVRGEISKRSTAPQPEPVMADGELTEVARIPPEGEEDETTDEPTEDQVPVTAETEEAPSAEEVIAEQTAVDPAAVEEETDEQKEGTTVAGTAVAVPKGREPVVASARPSVVIAGADIPGYSAGAEFKSGMDFGKAMAARIASLNRVTGGDGEQVLVASIRNEAPPERTLSMGDPESTWDKILEVVHPDSIVAAGGCCAPLTTRYELFDCGGSADRPVRDALAGFQADRGGIRFYPGPSLADIGGAVGFWTCADDEAATPPATTPVKACSRIECPPEQTAEIQAVTLCLTFGVMMGRVFPELAVANNKLAMVAHSRIADSALLAQIKAGSKKIADAGTPLSAVRDVLDTIGRAAMYMRDRYRLTKDANLRAIFPQWVLELLRGDIAKGMPVDNLRSSLSTSDAEIEGFFKDRNINVTWALDSATPGTNGGGFFTDATTTLPAWPTQVEWAMYPEGSWLYLDGGTLDLGIVRDSGLVKVNDYMEFSETFEATANIGCESMWITSQLSVTGMYACCSPTA
jgi:hypothetical protein